MVPALRMLEPSPGAFRASGLLPGEWPFLRTCSGLPAAPLHGWHEEDSYHGTWKSACLLWEEKGSLRLRVAEGRHLLPHPPETSVLLGLVCWKGSHIPSGRTLIMIPQ